MGKVKFGLSNVHIAPFTVGNDGAYTYETPFALPGAVNLTLDPSGDSADFHADNTIYFSDTANNGYEGSLEIAMITNEFREKILGETKDGNGAYIESADSTIKGFALGFQIDGDSEKRKFWYYNVSAGRPSNSSATIETSKEPQTDTFDIKAMPRISDRKVRSFLDSSATGTAAYNSFFEAVYEEVPTA